MGFGAYVSSGWVVLKHGTDLPVLGGVKVDFMEHLPSGKHTKKTIWKITFLVSKSTISVAMFNSYATNHQRVPFQSISSTLLEALPLRDPAHQVVQHRFVGSLCILRMRSALGDLGLLTWRAHTRACVSKPSFSG